MTAAWIAVLAVLAAFAAHTAGAFGDSAAPFMDDVVFNALVVAAAGLCWARVVAVRRERLGWGLIAVGLTINAAGHVVWAIFVGVAAEPAYPSAADLLWLMAYPVEYAGLICLVRGRLRDSLGASAILDGAIAALGAATIAAAVVVGALIEVTGAGLAEVLTNLAYPIFDLVLLAGVVGVLTLTGWRPGRGWILLGGGYLTFAIGDAVYLMQDSAGTYVEGTILDLAWPAGALLTAAAAWAPESPRRATLDGWRLFAVPASASLVAIGALTYDHFERLPSASVILAAVTLALVVVRMGLLFGEKLRHLEATRSLALTDPLTGLGNRRALMEDLSDVGEGGECALAVIDLDGFKPYNDTYGHEAGDVMLSRLGAKLSRSVEPGGSAYRLGGDEFCVVAHGPRAFDVVAGAAASLGESGEGFELTASYGAVTLPREARDLDDALRLADRRMYARKHRGERSAAIPAMAALRAVMREREPDLARHVGSVAGIAQRVARGLGLRGEELEIVVRAAELHDIGKLAVPDAILHKPGPLTEEEWEFIRGHTLVGERMLASVPALAPVAALIRSSHERFDGAGYPDALVGEQIPLGARIVAACDAYEAITSDRPYRGARAPAEALAELRRCAGSQFDPRVVEMLCATLEHASPAATLAAPNGVAHT